MFARKSHIGRVTALNRPQQNDDGMRACCIMDYDQLQRSVNWGGKVTLYEAGGGRIATAADGGVTMIDAVRKWKVAVPDRVAFRSGADCFSESRPLNREHIVTPVAAGLVGHALPLSGYGAGRKYNSGYGVPL